MQEPVSGTAQRILAIGMPAHAAATAIENAMAQGGMLIVMEADAARAEEARRRFRDSGAGARATVIAGDPQRMLYKLAGPFDLIVCSGCGRATAERARTLLAAGGTFVTDGTTDV